MAISSRDVENVLRTIFRRCNDCPTDTAPSCPPSCPAGTVCIQTPPSCTVCASTTCQAIPDASSNTQPAQKSGPNVGAIAGGVVGGVVFVAIMVFIVWKFCLKGRRRQYEEGDYGEVALPQEKPENDFASRRSARASTHTVASMASSVLTRASNIIQIAYIPGVTNRSGPGSPDLLVPPVPPIPIATSPSSGLSSPYATSEQHFFVPDLRDSTYSATTDARSSYARTSIAPSLARSSVATTIYRNNAIVSPLPAQTIVRGKAAVVSVKSSGSSSPSEAGMDTPPVPQIDPKHSSDPSKSAQPVRVQMPRMFSSSSLSPQNSVRSTATLGPVRALNITKKKKEAGEKAENSSKGSTPATSPGEDKLTPGMRPLTDVSVASTDGSVYHARARRAGSSAESDSDSDDDDHSRARKSLLRSSDVTDISQTPVESPFSDSSHVVDPADIPKRHGSTLSAPRVPLSPVREESSKRASKASKRTQSPFSDDNATE